MQKKVFWLLKSSYFSYISVVVGTLLSLLVAWESARWIETGEKDRFKIASDQILFLAQKQLQSTVQIVCNSAALFKVSDNVSKEDWKLYIDSHMLEKRFPSIEAIGYAPVIAAQNREAYEVQMRMQGLENYTIFPPLPTDPLVPITYIEPFNAINATALGFNSISEPLRKATIDKALERGMGTLSPKVEFILEKPLEEKIGFIIYSPVFKKGAMVETYEQKKENIVGYILAAIRAKSLFEELLNKSYIKIDYEIYDGTSIELASKLYDSNPQLTETRYKYMYTIDVYGRKWTFHFKANDVLGISWSRYVPLVQAFFGILFSLVVGRWLYALQRTREEAYRIAEEKTRLLARSEAGVRTIFQAMHEGIIVQNAQGLIIECNLAAQEIFGVSKEEMLGKTSAYSKWDAVHEDGSTFIAQERPAPKALRTGEAQENIIMGIVREDSTITWVQANAQPLFSDDFLHVESVVVTLSDITEYRKSKLKLEEYIAIIDANVIISSTNLKGIITEVSEAFCQISGYSKEELLGRSHNIVRHVDVPSSLYEEMWLALKKAQTWHGEIKNRRKDGSAYWVDTIIAPRYNEAGVMVGYTAIRQDITDKKRVEKLSITDRLTGLYNRLKLDELFALYLHIAKRHEKDFSILLLDIDKFKLVNDTYGHQVGDSVLKELSDILKENVRAEDAVGRWGGEEFLILLPSSRLDEALLLAQKLRRLIEEHSFKTVGQKTASFGLATYHTGDDEKSMVARADEALYRAKENGRNRVEKEEYTCQLL